MEKNVLSTRVSFLNEPGLKHMAGAVYGAYGMTNVRPTCMNDQFFKPEPLDILENIHSANELASYIIDSVANLRCNKFYEGPDDNDAIAAIGEHSK